ncbi:MAG: TetR/AcrR family transcriptional regulator [Micrococcaceae bacterium]
MMVTQKERRDDTIARLLDAAAQVLLERGYSATTVAATCERAGVSQGGLFRHFPTRRALLVATAQRVAERQTSDVPVNLTPHDAVRVLRDLLRSPDHIVWHELLHAARTDAELREELTPALREYRRRTSKAATLLLRGDRPWTPEHQSALRIIITYLEGESTVSRFLPDAERDQASLEMLVSLIRPLFEEAP